jgi:hypothetical protein
MPEVSRVHRIFTAIFSCVIVGGTADPVHGQPKASGYLALLKGLSLQMLDFLNLYHQVLGTLAISFPATGASRSATL